MPEEKVPSPSSKSALSTGAASVGSGGTTSGSHHSIVELSKNKNSTSTPKSEVQPKRHAECPEDLATMSDYFGTCPWEALKSLLNVREVSGPWYRELDTLLTFYKNMRHMFCHLENPPNPDRMNPLRGTQFKNFGAVHAWKVAGSAYLELVLRPPTLKGSSTTWTTDECISIYTALVSAFRSAPQQRDVLTGLFRMARDKYVVTLYELSRLVFKMNPPLRFPLDRDVLVSPPPAKASAKVEAEYMANLYPYVMALYEAACAGMPTGAETAVLAWVDQVMDFPIVSCTGQSIRTITFVTAYQLSTAYMGHSLQSMVVFFRDHPKPEQLADKAAICLANHFVKEQQQKNVQVLPWDEADVQHDLVAAAYLGFVLHGTTDGITPFEKFSLVLLQAMRSPSQGQQLNLDGCVSIALATIVCHLAQYPAMSVMDGNLLNKLFGILLKRLPSHHVQALVSTAVIDRAFRNPTAKTFVDMFVTFGGDIRKGETHEYFQRSMANSELSALNGRRWPRATPPFAAGRRRFTPECFAASCLSEIAKSVVEYEKQTASLTLDGLVQAAAHAFGGTSATPQQIIDVLRCVSLRKSLTVASVLACLQEMSQNPDDAASAVAHAIAVRDEVLLSPFFRNLMSQLDNSSTRNNNSGDIWPRIQAVVGQLTTTAGDVARFAVWLQAERLAPTESNRSVCRLLRLVILCPFFYKKAEEDVQFESIISESKADGDELEAQELITVFPTKLLRLCVELSTELFDIKMPENWRECVQSSSLCTTAPDRVDVVCGTIQDLREYVGLMAPRQPAPAEELAV